MTGCVRIIRIKAPMLLLARVQPAPASVLTYSALLTSRYSVLLVVASKASAATFNVDSELMLPVIGLQLAPPSVVLKRSLFCGAA